MELIREWRGYVGDDMAVLKLYDDPTRDQFTQPQHGLSYVFQHGRDVIFEGDDYGCSPLHAIDSDESVGALLGFLSLRPGGTDPEYFDSYTPKQLAWVRDYGEELALYAMELQGDI